LDRHADALKFLCGELDEVREENRDLRAEQDRKFHELNGMLHDEAPAILRFVKFMDEWAPKLKFISERILNYDRTFAELHKRLDEWDRIKTRLSGQLDLFERIVKGEST
jgi:hypothetical protein